MVRSPNQIGLVNSPPRSGDRRHMKTPLFSQSSSGWRFRSELLFERCTRIDIIAARQAVQDFGTVVAYAS